MTAKCLLSALALPFLAACAVQDESAQNEAVQSESGVPDETVHAIGSDCDNALLECLAAFEAPGAPAIAPDGSAVAFTIRKADWVKNSYDREIYLVQNGETRQLTDNDKGSSGDISWSPDGERIAYRAVADDGAQLFLTDRNGDNVVQLTALPGGVSSYVWSPDGRYMALGLNERPDHAQEKVKERFGAFTLGDEKASYRHLWLLDVEAASRASVSDRNEREGAPSPLRRLTGGTEFTLGSFFGGGFSFTPDGKEILFDHAESDSPYDLGTQDISAVNVETGLIRPIVRRPGIDSNPYVSPDGKRVVFHMGEPPYYYTRQYWVGLVSIDGGDVERFDTGVKNDTTVYAWRGDNIFLLSHHGVESEIFRYNVTVQTLTNLTDDRGRVEGVSISADGSKIAFGAVDGANPLEIYTRNADAAEERLTNFGEKIANWKDTEVRLVQWTTPDGLEIEGVLTLPSPELRPDGPMSVLTMLHGGPASTSRPRRVPHQIYPTEYWLRKGAAIFEPNYRGSGSYGDDFMAANVRSMGVGYATDVQSGIDYLIDEGIADPDKLGAMGWSAGGTVTAALATRTQRFKAFSVGAGVSDYRTYFYLSDQPANPLAYLEAAPWEDPDLYDRVGAMGSITQAVTPTLIQHGRDDGRVPFANGMELYRGLKGNGVATELVVFENTGHVISRPKERLAAMEQNVRWFDAYLFGDRDSPDLDLTDGFSPE